jgi:hypothetical protein
MKFFTEDFDDAKIQSYYSFVENYKSSHIIEWKNTWKEKRIETSVSTTEDFVMIDNNICKSILYIQTDSFEKTLEEAIDLIDSVSSRYSSKMAQIIHKFKSEFFLEIAEALNFLHSRTPSIIHNNFNAKNVLLKLSSGEKLIKILFFDFFEKKYLDDALNNLEIDFHNQKIHSNDSSYIAPEQSKYGICDEKSNIFSLGKIYNYIFKSRYLQYCFYL